MAYLWAYPISLGIGYLISRIYQAIRDRDCNATPKFTRRQRITRYFLGLHIILTCLLIATSILTAVIRSRGHMSNRWNSENYLSSTISVTLFYAAGLLPDPDVPYTVTETQSHMWAISLIFEIALLYIQTQALPRPVSVIPGIASFQVALSGLRIVVLCTLVGLYVLTRPINVTGSAEERESLFDEHAQNNTMYGSSPSQAKGATPVRSGDAQTTTWLDYLLGFGRLFPFLWPSDSRNLQLRATFCFCLLVVQRLVNIYVPHQMGVVVAALGPGSIPHKEILLYVLARALQGQQGVIGSIRALLWIPISQSTYQRLTTAAFRHVLMLSLDFHLSKRIGEVISALSKGSALNTFLDGLAFQLFPMVADMWIAAVYFYFEFDALYSVMVIAITWFYLFITIYMAKYRGRARREMVMREREMEAAKTDALLLYETVHYSSALPTEISRFGKLISSFQKAEYNVFFSLNLLNAVQNGVFTVGVALVCYLNAYQISMDMQPVAMFVTLLTYMAQLQAPLNFFGSFYTQVQNNLVDAERMLNLFKEEPTVVDREGAVELRSCKGNISFSDVSFSYNNNHRALHNISFDVMSGTSTAIVGESGSGKSTILKLLFRFYDVDSGAIKIDGIDIRDMKLESLRDFIGVVPQDTILFNDTVMFNLMYAKPDSTESEVYEACKAASIHDKIIRFPQGYLTSVGERGLKLSGGEKQRIAIARAFLRSPRILLLDEATASLDSQTEKQIQSALAKVSEGRTTLMIAHRLSTIAKADQIIVLHQGGIVERGRHTDLLAKRGYYAQMWEKQMQEEENKE